MSHYGANGFVLMKYYRGVYEHKFRQWVKIVGGAPTPGTTPDVLNKGSGNIDWRTEWALLVAQLRKIANTATDFATAELWYKPTENSNPVWIDQYAVAQTGASATAVVVASQTVLSFGTTLGGKVMIYEMETVTPVNSTATFPFAASAQKDIADYIVSDDNILCGFDGSFPVVARRWQTKTNDVLRRKIMGLGGA